MKDIMLYGAGGHSFAVVELIKSLAQYNPIKIVDDNPTIKSVLQVPVIQNNIDISFNTILCITVGNNKNRKKIALLNKCEYPIFIHNSVVKYPSAIIGKGTVILPHSVIDADVKIGEFCIINNNATISHNVNIKDYVHISINVAVSGGVKIGEGAFLGAGCIILPGITIGKWAIIGAGAVVTKDIPDNCTAVGIPAKPIKTH